MNFSGIMDAAEEFADFAEEAQEASDDIPQAIDEGLFQSVNEMKTTAERLAPESDVPANEKYASRQKLKESLRVFKTEDGWGYMTDAQHARPIEFGAGPHLIEAKNVEYLEFEWPDAPPAVRARFSDTFPTVRFERVNHPGNSRQPFFYPAFQTHKEDVVDNIDDNIDRVFERNFD